jgi:hypothetical protein
MVRLSVRAAVLMPLFMLSACIGGPPQRHGNGAPATGRPTASRPALPAPSADVRQCLTRLSSNGVRFTPLADQDFGGGCNANGSVRLLDIGTPVTNVGPITCALAGNFAAWVQNAAQPAARQVFDQAVVRVETFGTYSCRNIYGGRSGRLSEHAHANAIDVSAFVLADGRRITLLDGWRGDARDQRFLRLIHTSACRRFPTVLSPDYNAAHANHFHFDMSGRGFCR